MKKNFIRYIIIFFISVIFTFYLFEFYLLHQQDNIPSAKKKQIEHTIFKSSSKKEIYEKLKNIENISVVIPPINYLNISNSNLFSLSGMGSIKTIFCDENGYMTYYLSDRYGFNNPDTEWHKLEKTDKDLDGVVEYVLLGDSFVHGACVNRPNDIGSVLRNLSKKTVLNFGYLGNGTLITYATFREYVNFKARNVLLFYFDNDLYDLRSELKNEILIKYLNDKSFSQNLAKKQTEINSLSFSRIEKDFQKQKDADNIFRFYNEKKFYTKKNCLLKFIRLHQTKNFFYSFYNLYTENLPYDEFKFIIKDINERSKLRGGKVYFIFIPPYEKYSKYQIYPYSSDIIKKKIIYFLKKENIKIIDIHEEVFKNHKDPLSLFNLSRWHFNEYGYELMARVILRETKNLK